MKYIIICNWEGSGISMNLSIVEDSHSLFLNHKFQNVSKNGKMLDFDDTYIPEEIDELGLLKNKIINYLNNGEYERDIEKVIKTCYEACCYYL